MTMQRTALPTFIIALVGGLVMVAATDQVNATLYYDLDGATPGFGSWPNSNPPGANWEFDSQSAWTTDATGSSATATWQTASGVANGATLTQNVVFEAPGSARIGVGDSDVTDFIVNFGTFDLVRQGAGGTFRLQDHAVSGQRNAIFQFGGGNINVTTGTLAITGPDISGSFTKTGAGSLDIGTSPDGAGLTSVTIAQGTLKVSGGGTSALNSNTSVSNNGTLQLGRNITVGSFSGSGNISAAGANDNSTNFTLTSDSDVNASWSGTTPGGVRTVGLGKDGDGIWTVSGNLAHHGDTTIDGGTLLINGSHTPNYTQDEGPATKTVVYVVNSGGTLGGTGTISAADTEVDGVDITINTGGILAPGTSPGTLTLDLAAGELDVSGIGVGALQFELGDPLGAGTSDFVSLTTGVLNIGTLDFSDFDFTTLSGFGVGQYTLFETPNTIIGGIGTASGSIGSFTGTLGFADTNTDLVLDVSVNVIPEPSAIALLGLGSLLLWFRRRRF